MNKNKCIKSGSCFHLRRNVCGDISTYKNITSTISPPVLHAIQNDKYIQFLKSRLFKDFWYCSTTFSLAWILLPRSYCHILFVFFFSSCFHLICIILFIWIEHISQSSCRNTAIITTVPFILPNIYYPNSSFLISFSFNICNGILSIDFTLTVLTLF